MLSLQESDSLLFGYAIALATVFATVGARDGGPRAWLFAPVLAPVWLVAAAVTGAVLLFILERALGAAPRAVQARHGFRRREQSRARRDRHAAPICGRATLSSG